MLYSNKVRNVIKGSVYFLDTVIFPFSIYGTFFYVRTYSNIIKYSRALVKAFKIYCLHFIFSNLKARMNKFPYQSNLKLATGAFHYLSLQLFSILIVSVIKDRYFQGDNWSLILIINHILTGLVYFLTLNKRSIFYP